MAQDHIIFTLVHFNGCAGAKAPHSIIFNVGIQRLQIAPRRIVSGFNAKAHYCHISNHALLFDNDASPN
jgi:hypothetical protein